MVIRRFQFALVKAWLNHGGKKGLKKNPDFAEYRKFLNVDTDDSGIDSHRYDVILANPETRKGITLIDIHGGAYVYSTRRHNHAFVNYFLERGFDIVVLDYPLNNGKQDCQDQVNILWQQLSHLAKHYEEYGLAKPCFLTGDSAGGHYALLLACALGNRQTRAAFGFEEIDLPLAGVLANCPVYDFAAVGRENAMSDYVSTQLIGKRHVDESYLNLMSPKTHLPGLNVPLFFSSCTYDFLGSHSSRLEEDAKKLGKEHEYLFISSKKKAVAHVHNVVNLALPESKQVNDAMISFMERHA